MANTAATAPQEKGRQRSPATRNPSNTQGAQAPHHTGTCCRGLGRTLTNEEKLISHKSHASSSRFASASSDVDNAPAMKPPGDGSCRAFRTSYTASTGSSNLPPKTVLLHATLSLVRLLQVLAFIDTLRFDQLAGSRQICCNIVGVPPHLQTPRYRSQSHRASVQTDGRGSARKRFSTNWELLA